MAKNREDIEVMAVDEVRDIVARSECMKSSIVTNDKFVSWDGTISLYSDKSCRKENLIDRIDIQVKGESVKKFHGKTKNYSMQIADLRNYFNAGGTVLFVVEIDENFNKKVYYNALVPIDLKRYLLKAKDGQKNISVEVKKLPNSHNSLLYIIKNYLQEKNSQYRKVILDSKSIENYNYFAFDIVSEPSKIEDYLLENEIALYAVISKTEKLPFLDRVSFSQIITSNKINISIDGKEYYNTFYKIKTKDSYILKFGGISIEPNANKIRVDIEGQLENIINDMEFIIKSTEVGYILINTEKFYLSEVDRLAYNKIKNLLEFYKNLKRMFEFFGVEFHEDMKLLNENDRNMINELFRLYNNQKDIKEFGVRKVKISKISFLIIILPDNKNGYVVENYFGNFYERCNVFVKYDGEEMIVTTPYDLLKLNDIIESVNFNSKSIIDSLKRIPINSINCSIVTNMLLEFIKAFDITRREDIYDVACKINEYLLECYENEINNIINKYQLILRKRKLTKDEKNCLYQIKKCQNDVNILAAISIILENKSDFEYYFDQLTIESQDQFKNYPIYDLVKKLFNDSYN